MFAYVVRDPFTAPKNMAAAPGRRFGRGEKITDPAIIDALKGTPHEHNLVQVWHAEPKAEAPTDPQIPHAPDAA
jgi:hypothetical protein